MSQNQDYIQNLTDYIKKNLRKGYTKESLRWALLTQGNSKLEVERAFKRADLELAEQAPELKTKPQITYEIVEPKEFATKVLINKKLSLWKKLSGVFKF